MDRAAQRSFCRALLEAPDLAGKLSARPEARPRFDGPSASLDRDGIDAAEPTRPIPMRPARGAGLEMGEGAAPLPKPTALGDPAARACALARFAHHELQAVELFAWAILRWPEVPDRLAAAWLAVLADEQRHCALYLARVEALGHRFADFAPHSDYFWKLLPAIDAKPDGPAAFLAAMGLTLEQANLDFSAMYEEAFREAGDPESARVCAEVHADEISHVRSASRWLAEWRAEPTAIARYEASVPFPLGAARAKGRRFDRAARECAGLDDAFIDYIAGARSRTERAGG